MKASETRKQVKHNKIQHCEYQIERLCEYTRIVSELSELVMSASIRAVDTQRKNGSPSEVMGHLLAAAKISMALRDVIERYSQRSENVARMCGWYTKRSDMISSIINRSKEGDFTLDRLANLIEEHHNYMDISLRTNQDRYNQVYQIENQED